MFPTVMCDIATLRKFLRVLAKKDKRYTIDQVVEVSGDERL